MRRENINLVDSYYILRLALPLTTFIGCVISLMPSTFTVPMHSVADPAIVFAGNRPAFLTPRLSPSFRADADTEFICKLRFDR
jgi:hypothetical protein